jgi:predicted DNA-binding ribbon-helix-helix protein
MIYKSVRIEKPQWYTLKDIALKREKTLQKLIKEALSFYIDHNKPKLEE